MQTEFAPAKINLTLHVTGQRDDGYHVLDSLVAFADVGDVIEAELGQPMALKLRGPMAEGLTVADDNLVLRAARLMGVEAALTLEKRLPVSSGIGGGSADAAATLRLLARLAGRPLPNERQILSLGADVPACLFNRAVRMQGVGEFLTPVAPLPPAWLVLVNPRVAVSTPHVFRALTRRDYPPMPPKVPRFRDVTGLAEFLLAMRNDMEAAAINLAPVIRTVRDALAGQPSCFMARMSGSGATCFGLFPDGATALSAAQSIKANQPGWWTAHAPLKVDPAP